MCTPQLFVAEFCGGDMKVLTLFPVYLVATFLLLICRSLLVVPVHSNECEFRRYVPNSWCMRLPIKK